MSLYENDLISTILAQTTRKTQLFRNYGTLGKTREVCINVSEYGIEPYQAVALLRH